MLLFSTPSFLPILPPSFFLSFFPFQRSILVIQQLCCVRFFCDPMDYSPSRLSSLHGIFQARILEWVAISFSKRSIPSLKGLLIMNFLHLILCSRIYPLVYSLWELEQNLYPAIAPGRVQYMGWQESDTTQQLEREGDC